MLGKGQPQLSILKLRLSILNFGGAPAPAPQISMLTHDVFFFFGLFFNIEIGGAGGRWPTRRSEFKFRKSLEVVTSEVWQQDVQHMSFVAQSTPPNKRYV